VIFGISLLVVIKEGMFKISVFIPFLFIAIIYYDRLKNKRIQRELIKSRIKACPEYVEDDFQKKREGAIKDPKDDHPKLSEALRWSNFTYDTKLQKE
jgi:hypothetical protein